MSDVLFIARSGLSRLLNWKVRGIRWLDIICGLSVALMILSVYVAKAAADREDRRIAAIERDIAQNRQRVRLLRAEIARLEQPGRLEALSRAVGLQPVDVHRQATEVQLSGLQGAARPAPASDPLPTVAVPPAVAVPPVDAVRQ